MRPAPMTYLWDVLRAAELVNGFTDKPLAGFSIPADRSQPRKASELCFPHLAFPTRDQPSV
ncbi:hypothetical protein [Protofrankia symbiont of Coriaria ruscifolia]|uniref:Uncharacterized protein n=1 Tax=Candidatus Protofrankia californiensis TaxID=1839754 RepID=A0A1C3P1I2_9ACTN|nr:hypothetical protein [Protofrankia symbiont of Coriaria ruscifolia]SBW23644.1 hypothetical protein FDG2_3867 [Candidatus Protofrankia californiensis]